MAGHNKKFCAHILYLLHFLSAVVNPLLVIACNQCAASASAAELYLPAGKEVNPVFKALIQYPSWLVKIAVAEKILGFAPVVTGVVIGGKLGNFFSVQLYAAFLYITD
jgi:hypothetical protein